MLLACQNIVKTFVSAPVLKGGYFHIEEKEKAAVVGINGAGKSTLLNIITGVLSPDEGEVLITKGTRLGYLTQHQGLQSERSIYEELASAREDVFAMEKELRSLESRMPAASGEELTLLMERYSRLSHEFEACNGYAVRSEIAGVLKGLGFTQEEGERPCSVLSGGEKTRVALGKLLLQQPDLILLDEPTNHLDISSVSWLEGYLKDYPGAVLVVSHDRYFLDRFVTKIVEVENGLVSMFSGNYTTYAAKKQQAREIALKHYYNQQRQIRHEEEVISRLKSFNREKSIKRAESREKMLARIDRLEKPQELNDKMFFTLEPHVQSGNDVLYIENLSKAFGSRLLFRDLNLDIKRGEKAALIGDNGTGKTTLLKIINGLLPADTGLLKLGAKVKVGYYDQEQQLLTEENTLFDEIREAYPGMTDTLIRNTLAAFLFTGDEVFKTVSALSGGERGRLSLAKLILSPCNFLILDEPTNHLDMASREILEDALSHYTGTVLVVSHDRYFINRVAGRILELDQQSLTAYLGNYDDYLEEKKRRTDLPAAGTDTNAGEKRSDSARQRQARKEEETARRRKEARLRQTEAQIEEAEQKIARLEDEMARPETAVDAPRLLELSKECEALRGELDGLYAQWEELGSG